MRVGARRVGLWAGGIMLAALGFGLAADGTMAAPDTGAVSRVEGGASDGAGVRPEGSAMSPSQMRMLAMQALDAGRPDVAGAIANALLQRDPEDSLALAIAAKANRAVGNLQGARESARQAWRVAETDEERYEAAMARAQALASGNNRTAAMLWLRRAAQNAPTKGHEAVARDDFRYVRARNPLGVSLHFSLAPVSNLNNGSRREQGTFQLPAFGVVEADLDGTAQALSGIELSAGVTLRYRLGRTEKGHQTDLVFGASTRQYQLSDDAKDKAPDAKGSDYAFSLVQVGLSHRGRWDAKRPFRLSAMVGQTRYGGEDYTRFYDFGGKQSFAFENGVLSFGAGLRRSEALSVRTTDSDRWRADLSWTQPVWDNHRLTLALEAERGVSDSSSLDYEGAAAAARLALGQPVMGMGLEFGVSYGERWYDQGPVAGLGRLDARTTLDATAVIDPLEQFGFVPTVSVTARRVESDFGQYDSDEFGVRIGLRSAF
ncbi:M48 family metallopeptidase [Cognatishimia sp. F0-27]|uniref:tetratricopeptide repeat protein n=1 Tax=Cognatishimia sp. F0-27 TaxID=2816855 RepID=UPI001D0CA51F|nr:hypothetical protein [Cognatishimia sp. F0-27]MCC1494333.1 hypothetical protein [Cognatishimia sp. F0-27]